jgi:hypothetical protein
LDRPVKPDDDSCVGSDQAIHSYFAATWIASRSLSSGAHSRDPLVQHDQWKAPPVGLVSLGRARVLRHKA